MGARQVGAGGVAAGVPAPHGPKVALAATHGQAAPPAQDVETEPRDELPVVGPEEGATEAAPDHLGAVPLAGPAEDVGSVVLGLVSTDEGAAGTTVGATGRAAILGLRGLPAEGVARKGGAPPVAERRTLVDGEVVRRRAAAAGRL